MEVDNLRTINEKYGNKTGDRILQDTATLLKGTFRESDIISRIGGANSWSPHRASGSSY